VITEIIRYLSRRFNILAIKHVAKHSFDVDTPGTDSWRIKESGADAVALISGSKTALIMDMNTEVDPEEMIRLAEELRRRAFDVVFLEGFSRVIAKRRNIYKIIVARNREDVEYYLNVLDPPILAIVSESVLPNPPKYRTISFNKLGELAKMIASKLKDENPGSRK